MFNGVDFVFITSSNQVDYVSFFFLILSSGTRSYHRDGQFVTKHRILKCSPPASSANSPSIEYFLQMKLRGTIFSLSGEITY